MNALWSGRRPSDNVASLVLRNASYLSTWPCVLVSSVDSCTEVGSMEWVDAIVDLDRGRQRSSDAVVISGADLVRAAETDEVFFGFDEFWLCTVTPADGPPAGAYVVAPISLDHETVPSAVVEWLRSPFVVAGFGDGDGLNFVSRDRTVLEALGLVENAD